MRNYEQKYMVEVQSENSGKCDDYRKLRFFSPLLNNGNKKFKNKITRSSTFKNRAVQNFIKKIKEIKPGSPY